LDLEATLKELMAIITELGVFEETEKDSDYLLRGCMEIVE
jgi:hypothetical protein